jgi:hypothetical protein
MSVGEWRQAFTAGFLFSALANQRLLPTAMHVIQFALRRDPVAWIDALLSAGTPRLAAIVAELTRFADAILDEQGAALPVDGFGEACRDPSEGVAARVLENVTAFAREIAAASATWLPEHAELLRDVVLWDAMSIPGRGASAEVRSFRWDWPAYLAAQDSCPQPLLRAITVRCVPGNWAAAPSAATYLDSFLAFGWSKTARVLLSDVQAA